MNALPLRRVAYEDRSAVPPRPRSGSAAREEVNIDFNDYLLPSARMLLRSGQTWGVADGLEVSADANGTELRVAPGLAIDRLSRIVSLADEGKAIVAADVSPDAVTDVTTADVTPAGVTVATTGATGDRLLTVRWREVQVTSPSQLFQHTPWLALVNVEGFVDDGTQIVLAVVELDANGKILGLGAGEPAPNPGRRTLDSHTGSLELRRPREASPLSIDQVPAGRLQARPDGGLELNLLTPSPQTVLSVSPAGAVSLAPASGGSVGIGLGNRAPVRALHVEGNEIHSGGLGGGLSFADRTTNGGAYVDNPGATGARWVWYSGQKSARLWSGTDKLTIDAAGNIGVGTIAPRAGIHSERGQTNVPALLLAADGPGWGSGLQLDNQSDGGRTYGVHSGSDGSLHIIDVGDVKDRLVINGVGNVGLGGISAPARPLHVLGEAHVGGRGAALSFGDPTVNGIVESPANGERWKWYVEGGEARLWSGKDRLRISNVEGGGLDVGRRMRMRQGGDGSAGTWLNQDVGGDRAFIGMAGENLVGFYGIDSGWSVQMDTSTGALGIGTNNPQRMVHVEQLRILNEIHSGGGGSGGFSMGDSPFVSEPANGERYVWYATGGTARLWSNTDIMTVDNAGNLWIRGKLSKSLTQFKIDHPLDPENKYLVHSGIESDQMRNLYDGRIELDENGGGVVDLPDWFEALNTDLCYHLTAVGAPGPDLHIAQELVDNSFRIAGGSAGATVCWQVTGVRHDAYAVAEPMVVEEDKPEDEKGTLIHPEAHGESTEKSAFRKAGESKSNAMPLTLAPPTGP